MELKGATMQKTLHGPADLMQRFNVTRQRLRYAIESRGIKPAARFGTVGVFDDEGVNHIEKALQEVAARKDGK
jgi:hypothetical protein